MGLGHFGPLVIGERQHAAEQAIVKAQAHRFGPLVVDQEPAAEPAAQEPEAQPGEAAPGAEPEGQKALSGADANADGYVSVVELAKALKANPALVDTYFPAELKRDGGPRKTALLALVSAEQAREGGPRAEALAALEHALAAHS